MKTEDVTAKGMPAAALKNEKESAYLISCLVKSFCI